MDAKYFPLLEEICHQKYQTSAMKLNEFNAFIPSDYITNTTKNFKHLKVDFGPMSVLTDSVMLR